MKPIITEKFLTGLQKRVQLGENAIFGSKHDENFKGITPSLARSFHLVESGGDMPPLDKSIYRDLVIIKSAHNLNNLDEQKDFIEQLKKYHHTKYLKEIAIGNLVSNRIKNENLNIDSTLDYSIVAQSFLFAKCKDFYKSSIGDATAIIFRNFIRKVCKTSPYNSTSLSAYFNSLNIPADIRSILDISEAMSGAKSRYWYIFGADIFSIFQILCDPRSTPSIERLNTARKITEIYSLEKIFTKLVIIRALANYQSERKYLLRSKINLTRSGLDMDLVDRIQKVLSRTLDQEEKYKGKPRDLLDKLIVNMLELNQSIRSENVTRLQGSLIALYELDKYSILFADLPMVHNVLIANNTSTNVQKCFVNMLMTTNAVIEHFGQSYSIVRGKGQFIASTVQLLLNYRTENKTVRDFLFDIKKTLPSKCAMDFIEFILQRQMLERLTPSFMSTASYETPEFQKDDKRRSELRVYLASEASKIKIISENTAQRIIDEERDFVRLHYFFSQAKLGKILLDWDFLNQDLIREFSTHQHKLFPASRLGLSSQIESEFIRQVFYTFAREIADLFLFDSPKSMDAALKDNLRHGVVVLRFVRAFNEAIHRLPGSDDKTTVSWNSKELKKKLGPSYNLINEMREHVLVSVQFYVDKWLFVERGGEFRNELIDHTVDHLIRSVQKKKISEHKVISKELISIFKHDAKKIIPAMQKQALLLGKDISTQLQECRTSVADEGKSRFFDDLDTELAAAKDELHSWVQLVEIGDVARDFQLCDLIDFELRTLFLSNPETLNINTRFLLTQAGRHDVELKSFFIKGQYFELFFQIIHNLLQNAIKYSGYDLKTRVSLIFKKQDDSFIIRCENNMSKDAKKKSISENQATNKLIRSVALGKAKGSRSSGFRTIHEEAKRRLKKAPSINIPPTSLKSSNFIVEITLKGSTQGMFGDA